ncbi:MAG: hypothetical protein LH478_02265, partial [Chitinophagaceae bacterium]|nr:hypothetical protein [Chitinophagaceae bacterium]
IWNWSDENNQLDWCLNQNNCLLIRKGGNHSLFLYPSVYAGEQHQRTQKHRVNSFGEIVNQLFPIYAKLLRLP